jgi:hypothetical protein
MHQANPQAPSLSLCCPSCQARLKASRQLLGRNCPCPRCRHPIQVRIPIPSDSDIHLVEADVRSATAGAR